MSFFLFGKKKNEETKQEANTPAANAGHAIASVKILGSGCASCNQLEKATKEALQERGLSVEIEHVRDFADISAYGVMSTPALVVNETVLSFGKVLKKKDVLALLETFAGTAGQ